MNLQTSIASREDLEAVDHAAGTGPSPNTSTGQHPYEFEEADGKRWRLVGNVYYCILDPANDEGDDDPDAGVDDPVELTKRWLARHNHFLDRAATHEVQRRERLEHVAGKGRARAKVAKAEACCRIARTTATKPRPRSVRARPLPASASVDPTPPAPRAQASELAEEPAREASAFAQPAVARGSLSMPRGAMKLGPATPLDQRLLPVAHALADLLLADLLKYPPKP